MTTLQPGSEIRREIRVPGIDVPVCVVITSTGVSFWCKGSRKKTWTPWAEAIAAGTTPADVPSYLMGKPLELLRWQADKQ